jgi:hypothetical protein
MRSACEQIGLERLTAWVDGRLPTESAVRAMAAHVAACPECAASAARLRAQKERLRRFRASTNPGALPTGLWEKTTAALDGAIPPNRPSHHRQPTARPRLGPRRVTLALAAALAVAVALPLALLYRKHPMPPVETMLARPIPARVTFVSDDADRAARSAGQATPGRYPSGEPGADGGDTGGSRRGANQADGSARLPHRARGAARALPAPRPARRSSPVDHDPVRGKHLSGCREAHPTSQPGSLAIRRTNVHRRRPPPSTRAAAPRARDGPPLPAAKIVYSRKSRP